MNHVCRPWRKVFSPMARIAPYQVVTNVATKPIRLRRRPDRMKFFSDELASFLKKIPRYIIART
jgi:hypothetical protein